eukprot:symbB.v1.2.014384.t1/scaffold1052.1/size141681/1
MAAAVEASLNSNSRLERFDGTDPSSYRRWKRRAQLMLIGLPNTYPAEKLGPKLMEFLAGDAELAVEHIKVEDLAKAGGEKAVFKALDERYKPLERDNMNEALKEFFFETQIRSGETMQAFATRFSTTIRKLEEQEVKLPDAVKGWFLLRKLHLDSSQESMIMTGTGGSYEIKDIYKAVKAILPNVKGTASKSGRERDTLVAEHPAVSEDEDDSELVQVLAAELQQKDEYEDEELLDVYETYKQVRMKMNDAKKARGYRSTPAAGVGMGRGPWKLQGSISARLEQAKAASQCHRCKQYGHWKRECPKGKGKGGDARGSSSTAKEVHIVDSGAGFEDGDYEELIRDIDAEMEDELTGLDVYVAEHDRSGFMLERFRSSVGVGSQHAEVAKEALGQWSHQSMDDCEPRTVTSLGIEQRPEPVVLRSFEVHSSEKEFPSQAEYAAALDSHAAMLLSPDSQALFQELGQVVSANPPAVISHNMEVGLDMYPDAASDSPRQTELRGSVLMSEGKHKPRAGNPGWSMGQIYLQDKGYVKWVRSHINQGSGRMMRRLKLYIEMRDRQKAARMDLEENGGALLPPFPMSTAAPHQAVMSQQPTEMVYPGPAAPQVPAPYVASQRSLFHTPPCSNWSRVSTPVMTPKMSCKRTQREDDMEIQEMQFEVAAKWRRMTLEAIRDAEEKRQAYVFNVARLMDKEDGVHKAVQTMACLMSPEIPELMKTSSASVGLMTSGPMP